MNRLAQRLLAPVMAAALAAGLFLQMKSYAAIDTTQTVSFHAAVRQALDQIPYRIGDGENQFDGEDKQPPAAAGKLLRPNGRIFSRLYRSASGRWATVVLVPCMDSRDMSGHYPPNCYRGSGWMQEDAPIERDFAIWGRQVPLAEYAFSRPELGRPIRWVVYDTFVLPAGGFVTRMSAVQDASGDYRTRPYGAAQIQVIFDGATPEPERFEIMRTLLAPFATVIDRLQLKKEEAPS
jgi:hypothetical protein